jgi:hypothetical protein
MKNNLSWPFQDDPGTPCVTTKSVTSRQRPILYVSRETDEDGELTWQFHCAEKFRMENAQLVRLDTIFATDASVGELGDLPLGYEARRTSPDGRWMRNKQETV